MKHVFKWTAVLLLMQVWFTGCSKIDWNDVWHDGNKTQRCDAASFMLGVNSDQVNPFFFTKVYDPSGKYVKEINAAFNNVRYPADLVHYPLRLEYKPSKIYFIRMESPFDTVVTAWLNHQGRVSYTSSKGGTYENTFVYRNNRLFSIQWHTEAFGVTDTCVYDVYGNIMSIAHYESFYGERDGYFYEYDYAKKAKQQVYFEETRNINNDFTLMQYMGFFPELNPVNLRTHSKLGLQQGYGFENYIGNHLLDAKGKLIQYDLLTPPGTTGDQQIITRAFLTWNCK